MTFLALLTKEMRLRLRRERTIWIMVVYLLLMGLLGWLFLSTTGNNYSTVNGPGLSEVGTNLYAILSQVQLFLIVFITPSFTATAINGEKERQTYDMLLCSRLSSFSMVLGKLSAGILNTLLLIAASLPLFSLVFFFGGISPLQVVNAVLVYIATTLWVATMSLFCSAFFSRPAISTGAAYIISLAWMLLPFLLTLILLSSTNGYQFIQLYPQRSQLLFAWNPAVALLDTYPPGGQNSSPIFYLINLGYGGTTKHTPITLGTIQLSYWVLYIFICLLATCGFFLLTMLAIRPHRWSRLRRKLTSRSAKKDVIMMQEG
jgi:ABC-type transport system involved in multi-copper enzyme maturation permease subunit